MRHTQVVRSPNHFVIGAYAPGFTIDFREPAELTDVEQRRRTFDVGRISGSRSEAELVREAGRILVELGITEDEQDFAESLRAHTGEAGLGAQLAQALVGLGVEQPSADLGQRVLQLLHRTHCLERAPHYALRLYCHPEGGTTELEDDATHYGYTLEGECVVTTRGRSIALGPSSYFCIGGGAIVEGRSKCVLITRFGYRGMTLFGGEVESWGRLEYIDGCTDTLLIAPPKKGDPCFNALYFPPATLQTAHVHPSVRCGVVIAGRGHCRTHRGEYPLEQGNIFFLPPETYHSFCTDDRPVSGRAALAVVAFHPDSDFGPTDEDHPMINRTYFKFLHRLRSSTAIRPAPSSVPRS